MSHIRMERSFRVFLVLLIICLAIMTLARSPTPTPTVASPSNSPTALPTETSPASESNMTAKQGPATEIVKWTDRGVFWAMLGGILLQLAISGIGFSLIWLQISQLNRGIRGETQSRLYEHYLKVNELLSEQSKLRPYFYACKELKEDAAGYADLRDEIDMMCEIIAGLLEHAAVQEENLPKDSWEFCWKAYTHERFAKSIELRKFFRDNREWYAESFRRVVGEKYPHLIRLCKCSTAAAAKDCCPRSNPVAGVPQASKA